jgi:hypothetical protein
LTQTHTGPRSKSLESCNSHEFLIFSGKLKPGFGGGSGKMRPGGGGGGAGAGSSCPFAALHAAMGNDDATKCPVPLKPCLFSADRSLTPGLFSADPSRLLTDTFPVLWFHTEHRCIEQRRRERARPAMSSSRECLDPVNVPIQCMTRTASRESRSAFIP